MDPPRTIQGLDSQGRLTPTTCSRSLGLTSAASAANLLGPLRALGLVDENDAPTQRARDWRDDGEYAAVCEAIVQEVYPDTLRSAFPDPKANSEGVANWFSRNTGSGRGASTAMAGLYTLLIEADPNGGKEAGSSQRSPRRKPTSSRRKDAAPTKPAKDGDRPARGGTKDHLEAAVHVNIQIHIAADASADQIDQIFESMAKHLHGE